MPTCDVTPLVNPLNCIGTALLLLWSAVVYLGFAYLKVLRAKDPR